MATRAADSRADSNRATDRVMVLNWVLGKRGVRVWRCNVGSTGGRCYDDAVVCSDDFISLVDE
jgi:hypothetical protein